MPTVLITREHAEPLSDLLAERGVASTHVPMLRLTATGAQAPSVSPGQVLVTSAAAVRFAPGLAETVRGAGVVAVGPATAAALEAVGVTVTSVGTGGGLTALRMLKSEAGALWYIGAEQPSPGLAAALTRTPIHRWPVYRAEALPVSVDTSDIDAVVFTSGRTIEAYLQANGLPDVPVAVLGPTTQGVAEALGVPVDVCAGQPTLSALADAVAALF